VVFALVLIRLFVVVPKTDSKPHLFITLSYLLRAANFFQGLELLLTRCDVMTHCFSKARFAYVSLFVALVITAGFAVFCGSPCNGVLTVAAQGPLASTTVVNNVTFATSSISLGSTVQATGKATVGAKPLANAAVSLHMGDVILADAQTNGNGAYSFAAPVGVYYFPAAFSNSATIYTVVEPGNGSLPSAPSAVTAVSVDLFPLSVIIAAVIVAILLGLYLFVRRMRGKAVLRPLGRRRVKQAEQTASGPAEASLPEASAQNQQELAELTPAAMTAAPPQEAPELEPASPAEHAAPLVDEGPQATELQQPESEEAQPESVAETGVLKQARDFFEQGNDRQGVNALYDAALTALATTHEVKIASSATHWEKYYAVEAAVPGVQAPLRTLTLVYERANYAGKALTDEQRNAALEAFRAIKAHVERVNEGA